MSPAHDPPAADGAAASPDNPDPTGENAPDPFDGLAAKIVRRLCAKPAEPEREPLTVEAYEALLEAQQQSARQQAEQAAALPRPADRPYWVPAGDEFDRLPSDLKQAVVQVINPVYQQLVLHAPPGLAQSTGLTIVHLMWLETLEQLELARLGYAFETLGQLFVRERHDVLERNLRTVMTKLKASRLLTDYERMKAAMLREQAARAGINASPPVAGAPVPAPPQPTPPRKIKFHADGRVEYPDGAIKHPDGRWEHGPPNPRFADPDFLRDPPPEPQPAKELPAGCIRLGNGSIKFPCGCTESPCGMITFRHDGQHPHHSCPAGFVKDPETIPAPKPAKALPTGGGRRRTVAEIYGPEFAALHPDLQLIGGRRLANGDRRYPGGWLRYPDGRLEDPDGHVHFPINWSPDDDPDEQFPTEDGPLGADEDEAA
jgi:hypothetical protein